MLEGRGREREDIAWGEGGRGEIARGTKGGGGERERKDIARGRGWRERVGRGGGGDVTITLGKRSGQ